MPKGTDIQSNLIIGAFTPSPRRGEGSGEGARRSRVFSGVEAPHPVGGGGTTTDPPGAVG
jgi:hypothetical protein